MLTKPRRLLAVMAMTIFAATLHGRDRTAPNPYLPAHCGTQDLTLFPLKGKAVTIPLPLGLRCVGFSLDGKSLYAMAVDKANSEGDKGRSGLLKIEFNPTRVSPVANSLGLVSVANSAIPLQQDTWSPDGKWSFYTRVRGILVLTDARDPARRRVLGRRRAEAWSPDSRYLLLEKSQWRCGIYFDVEGPGTLEMVNLESWKRLTIQSSQCQVESGVSGWASIEVLH